MSTDPFSDIAFQQEIGQPTYAELIYTEVRVGKTFPPSTATVDNSLARLAYGKPGPYRDVEAQTPPKITAVAPHPTRRRYNIGATAGLSTQEFKTQRVATEFRNLLRNLAAKGTLQSFLTKSAPECFDRPWPTTHSGSFGGETTVPTYYPTIDAMFVPVGNYLVWDLTDIPELMRVPNGGKVRVQFEVCALTGDGPYSGAPNARAAIMRSGYGTNYPYMANGSGFDFTPATDPGKQADLPKSLSYGIITTELTINDSDSAVPSIANQRALIIGGGSGHAPIVVKNVTICPVEELPAVRVAPSCTKVVNGNFAKYEPEFGAVPGWIWDPSSYGLWDGNGLTIQYGHIYQEVTGLTVGQTYTVTIDAIWKTAGHIGIKGRAAILNGTDVFDEEYSGVVGEAKTITITFTATSEILFLSLLGKGSVSSGVGQYHNALVQFSMVSLCQTDQLEVVNESTSCTDPITDVRTYLTWDGIPRQPVNVFNMIARLTYRDAADPLVKTVVDMLATQDGRLGTVTPSSCSTGNTADFWKQQGVAGSPQTAITPQGLNLATTNAIVAGQFASVTSKSNWLWAIPGSTAGTLQDAMVSLWPDGNEGILESIEFLLLTHAVNATGSSNISESLGVLSVEPTPGKPQLIPTPTAPGEFPAGVPGGTYYRTQPSTSPLNGSETELDCPNCKSLGSMDFIFETPENSPPYSQWEYWIALRWPDTLTNGTYLKLRAAPIINGQVVSGQINGAMMLNGDTNIAPGEFVAVSFPDNVIKTLPVTSVRYRVEVFILDADEGQPLPQVDLLAFKAQFVANNSSVPSPVCAGPFGLSPDPAQTVDLTVRYTNSRGQSKEFSKPFSRTALYQTTATFAPAPDTWDTQVALGKGIKGSTARWESAKFVLDAVDGSGLDQCTEPVIFVASGKGTLNFKKLGFDGKGTATAACDAEVRIEEINKGLAVNEIQSIVLPSPSGGTWTITFNYAGQALTTNPIAWNATANQVKNALQTLENIGTGNVRVSGAGTIDTPYDVEFIELLSARDLRMLVADGSGLTGSSSGYCTKISVGTLNERQTITKNAGINADLLVTFAGVQSVPIAFNASLDDMEAALEGISTIGAGNVTVTGNTSDREADYQGPWYVDFIGALAGQNVGQLVTQTTGYSAVTNWQGGTGVNDIQKITISASAGTFKLTAQNPAGGSDPVTTEAIALNANANQIKSRLLQACDWLVNADLNITKLPVSRQAPDLHEWTIEFTGQWAHKSMPLLGVDGTALAGAEIIVRGTTKGTGSSERQKISLYKAQGGSYRLTPTIDGVSATTVIIPWDASAEGIEFALQALPLFSLADDVTVKDTEIRGEGVVASFIVTFNRRFGDVPLMTAVNNLQCQPLALSAVGPPPYDYVLPKCDDEEAEGCSPGAALCRPDEGDAEVPEEICCDPISIRDSANVYREVMLQRDLFDPNARTTSGGTLTVRDMAVLKGLRPSQYNAYLRDFHTGVLRPVEMTTPVDTKMSVILIGADIDTKATRERIGRELKRRPGILPSRMSWSHPALQG